MPSVDQAKAMRRYRFNKKRIQAGEKPLNPDEYDEYLKNNSSVVAGAVTTISAAPKVTARIDQEESPTDNALSKKLGGVIQLTADRKKMVEIRVALMEDRVVRKRLGPRNCDWLLRRWQII